MARESPTEIKPWTIRGIRPEIRNAAIAAAKRDKLELGEWFNRNIPAIIQHIRRQNRMPAVRPEPASVRPEARLSDYLNELERMAEIMLQVRDATGRAPPKVAAGIIYGLQLRRLRELKAGLTEAPAQSDQEPDRTVSRTGHGYQSDCGAMDVLPANDREEC
jgi:hypothetical protein